MIPSISKEDSGTRHRSTSPLAKVACSAMKPLCLPINLTMPIPLGQASASVLAASIIGMAASTAEVKPNELSMRGTCVDALAAAATPSTQLDGHCVTHVVVDRFWDAADDALLASSGHLRVYFTSACVGIKFRAPHAIDARCCLRSCVCAMAWRFHAIDATVSP